MAVTGWKDSGLSDWTVAAPFASGTLTWSDTGAPGNIGASDNAYCNVGTGGPDTLAKGLVCNTFGFLDADVPSGATIDGIEFQVENKGSSSSWHYVRIVKGGVIGTDTGQDNGTGLSASDTYKTYGGSASLWGETWTQTDIKAAGFGIVFDAEGPPFPWSADIDHVQCRIYYTAAAAATGLPGRNLLGMIGSYAAAALAWAARIFNPEPQAWPTT